MSSKPVLCLIASLAIHLALFLVWRSSSTSLTSHSSIPVFLLGVPAASAPAPLSPRAVKPSPAEPARKQNRLSSSHMPDAPPAPASAPVMTEDSTGTAEADRISAIPMFVPEETGFSGEKKNTGIIELPLLPAIPRDDNPEHDYPKLARERGWEGEVLLRVQVDSRGAVLKVELARSSGFPVLDRAARKGMERWRFTPARRGTVPVESTVDIPISFVLHRE